MKVAVIGAMEEEVTLLRENMDVERVDRIANSEFTSGTFADKEMVLLKSGIGKVNAALTTAVLLEKYKPDYVINTGSAGGFDPKLNIGDLVISTEVRHHDVDATAFGYVYGQVPQMPEGFKADEKLIAIAAEAVEVLEDIQSVEGLIGTGDSFMSDSERVAFVREMFPSIQAAEMEGAAIAQVAYQFDVPFVVIRSLSDIAGQSSEVSFEQFIDTAAVNSAKLVMEIIRKL